LLKNKKLLLIDGHGLIYRAYYALERTAMATSGGKKTWAVYGFIHLLSSAIEEEKPDCVAISFDLSPPTVRLEKYEDYKAQRESAPDALKEQIPYILNFVEALRIPMFQAEGYEADDCIATLAKRGEEEGANVYILSGDSDLFQLVSEKTLVLYPDRGAKKIQRFDVEEVKKKYNLSPEQLLDFKALRGDASDNIPGVPGIGKVWATKLLNEFETLEDIIKNADKIKSNKIKEIIKEHEDKARKSRELVKLYTDLPLPIDWDKCRLTEPDSDKLKAFLEDMELKSFLPKYGLKETEKKEPEYNPLLVTSDRNFLSLKNDLEKSQWVSVDSFTRKGPSIFKPLLGIGITTEKGNYYIPFTCKEFKKADKKQPCQGLLFEEEEAGEEQTGEDYFLQELKPFLENEKLAKYGFDLKDFYINMASCGIKPEGLKFDVRLAAFLLDSERPEPTLSYIVSRYLSLNIPAREDILGKGKKALSLEDLSTEDLAKCSLRTTVFSKKLVDILSEKLKTLKLDSLFFEMEMPLIPVLARMQMRGISLDKNILKELSLEAEKELKKSSELIYSLAGEEFNINSPRQLGEILFEKLKLPEGKKTKTGYSTASEILEPLREKYEIVGLVLDYRELNKLKTTYLDVLPALIDPVTGKLHTHFNQMITSTGRLSSSEPNLQNIPVRTEFGKLIRKAFKKEKSENILLAVDYSQIELRVFAHFALSEKLLRAFSSGRDIHSETARDIFNLPEEREPDSSMRRIAKTVNFGIIYGISDFGLAKNLVISKEEAKKYIDSYFEKFPGVKVYMEKVTTDAKEKGYVSTISGRRRNVSKLSDPNFNVRRAEERVAINAPIQGSAADIIKTAMIRIDEEIESKKLKTCMVLQVHDELIFELPSYELDTVKNLIKIHMESAMKLDVPLCVELKAGENWCDMNKIQ